MDLASQISQTSGLSGNWSADQRHFRSDPLVYGYLTPIQQLDIEPGGLQIVSSPVTNTEWWHQFIPVSTCPRYKMQGIRIPDGHADFCLQGQCDTACGAEDGFVDLSAGRLRLIEEASLIQLRFPRLDFFLARAERLTREVNASQQTHLMLDISERVVRLRARIQPDMASLVRHLSAFRQLYPQITQIHDKVNTAFLPQPKDFSDVAITEESVLEEARFYALQEGVRQEAVDILRFLVERKGGSISENEYYLPQEQMVYTLMPLRIEAARSGLYMGTEGFRKGVQEVQRFFQTTLGGGRW